MTYQIDPISIGLGAGGGIVLGLLYFWGLWLTTARIKGARSPGLLLVASALVRLAFLLGGAFLLTGGAPLPLAAFIIGLWAARKVAVGRVQRMTSEEAN